MDKNELILYCKKKEMEALKRSEQWKDDPQGYGTWQGKASAFSEVWEYLVFNGLSVASGRVHPSLYNKRNEYWSHKVKRQEEEDGKNGNL